MSNEDIKKRIINNDTLFNTIHVIQQKFEILPNNKEHIGACIDYQDISELRDEFLNELIDSVIDWVYSSNKYCEMKEHSMSKGKSEAGANSEIRRKAHQKFRKGDDSKLLVQGQIGELLLFHFIQRYFKAAPLLRKMKITTSSNHERFGADAIHYKFDDNKNIIILGEAKTYTSKYKFNEAFEDALNSILDTYIKHRKELFLYVHEDFLDEDMNKIAESYLDNTMEKPEVHLVSIIIYDENKKLNITDEDDIKNQINKIICERYKKFDNSKIKINENPILKRITYITFPIWKLEEIARAFQDLI